MVEDGSFHLKAGTEGVPVGAAASPLGSRLVPARQEELNLQACQSTSDLSQKPEGAALRPPLCTGTRPGLQPWGRGGVGGDGGGVLGHYNLVPAPPVLHSIILQVQLARQLHLVEAIRDGNCGEGGAHQDQLHAHRLLEGSRPCLSNLPLYLKAPPTGHTTSKVSNRGRSLRLMFEPAGHVGDHGVNGEQAGGHSLGHAGAQPAHRLHRSLQTQIFITTYI